MEKLSILRLDFSIFFVLIYKKVVKNIVIEKRYSKNIGTQFPIEIQKKSLLKTVAIIGCGGIGGYLIEHLSRLGVKTLIVFDGDKFEESNLNRQLYCNYNTLKQNKALVSKKIIKTINKYITIIAIDDYFSSKYLDLIISNNVDIIFSVADPDINFENLGDTLTSCLVKNIPIICGGVRKDDVSTIFNERRNLNYWFEFKYSMQQQSLQNNDIDNISSLSCYNSLAADLMINMYIKWLKNSNLESNIYIFSLK